MRPKTDPKALFRRDTTTGHPITKPRSADRASTRLRSASSLLALEPRMLFDGAAAATFDGVPQDQHHETPTHADTRAEAPAPPSPTHSDLGTAQTLVVIDGAVADAQQFVQGVAPNTEVLVLDSARDGLAQIEQALNQIGSVNAIHIVSHGEPGALRLGSTSLSNSNIAQFERELSAIGARLTEDADVLLYGCDVAAGSRGDAFLRALASATHADVAASTDATGSAAAGGDWDLEARTGAIESSLPFSAATLSAFDGLLAPAPQVTLSSSQQVLIGENFTFTATFSNTGPDAGYGPYADLFVRSNGVDGAPNPDGITITSATYLGRTLTLTAVPLTDIDAGTPGIQVAHPYFLSGAGATANRITAPAGFVAGDTMYVVQLPFGSVTPGSPALPIQLSGTVSNRADLGTPLNITARAGFQYGQTPLNDPATDPSVVQSGTVTTSITPTLYRVSTSFSGLENETVTGPNYEQQVIVNVDIANGQTVTNLDLTSLLPTNAQFVRIETGGGNTTGGGSATSIPSTSTPGGALTYRLNSVVGTGAASDARLVYSFYVPERDASSNPVINATTGDAVLVSFNTRVQGAWTPVDTRDSSITFDDNPAGAELTITAKSIAVQKSSTLIELAGVAGVTPGDRYRYQLDGQVSDFFAFGGSASTSDFLVVDELSDGQNFLTASTLPAAGNPTLAITRNGATQNYTFQAGEFSSVVNATGSTTITFNVRAVLARVGAAQTLEGDQFDRTGTPDNTRDEGVTTFRIAFDAEVRENYRVNPPGGSGTRLTLNENDPLRNDVTVAGRVLDGDLDPSKAGLQTESDNSSVSSNIQQSGLQVAVVGLNGAAVGGSPVVRPGDDVTYRLRYTVPTGDYENFRMSTFLPLPLLRVGDPDANGAGGPSFSQQAFSAGTFPTVAGYSVNATSGASTISLTPSASVSSSANSISFNFGDRDDATNQPLTIDVYFTLKATDEPFVDRLFLSSLGQADGQNTATSGLSSQEIGQLQFAQPIVNITKGYVADDVVEATSVFDPAYSTSNPTTHVRAAGDPSANPLLANITSTNGNRPILDANVSNIDAGDTIRAAIVVENTGSSSRGAFDVTVRDQLTPGFSLAAVPNLRIVYGNGTVVPLSAIADTSGNAFANEAAALAALLSGGIRFVDTNTGDADPSNDLGALAVGRDAGTGAASTTGTNILVITYDVTANASVQSRQVLDTAPATLVRYGSVENGTNFAGGGIADDASATIAAAAVAKSIVATGQPNSVTSGNNVVIGETVQYEVVIRLPEGVTNNTPFAFRDILDGGLGLVSVDSVATSGVTFTGGAITDPSTDSRVTINGARTQLDLNFGAITNTNTDNAVAETITVRYTAVVLNVAGNQGEAAATQLNNAVGWDGQANRASAPNVTVVEPAIAVTVTPSATLIDADDTVTYTIVITNNGNAPAQEVDLASIPMPSGLTYVGSSFTNTAGVVPTTINTGTRSATFTTLSVGQSSTFSLQAVVATNVTLGQTFNVNATTTFTSTPGTPGDFIPSLTTDTERTGAGGVDNYSTTGNSSISVLPAQPQLRIVSTSESSSGGSGTLSADNVAIGEIIRYRAVVELPESASTGFQIRPALPAGLVMTNASAVSVGFISNNSMTLPSDLTGAQLTGSAVIAPQFVLPGSRITGVGTATPVFSLGDITNLDSDADIEYVVIEFNAVVQNAVGNQDGNSGNANFVVRTNGVDRATSNSVATTIDEPTVTIDKRITGVSGSVVTYEVVVTNTGAVGTPTAFDLQITDEFVGAVNQTFNGAGSVTVFAEPSPGSVTNSSDADTLSATLASLAPGQSVTLRYTATVTDTTVVVPTRNAEARFTGLSTAGESLSVTIGGTPVTTTSSAERTGADGLLGSGALNDYRVQDADAPTLITGRVWNEIVTDGTVTSGEPLINGLTVTSIGAGTDTVFGTSDDVTVATAITNASGNYSMLVAPGTYRMTVPATISGGPFNGFVSSYDTDGGTTNATAVSATSGGNIGNINFGYRGPNSAPVISALDATRSGNYVENATPIQIDSDVTVADTQLNVIGNYGGATVTVARQGGANAQDVFGVSGVVSISAGNLIVSGITIGTVTNSGGALSITFNTNATQARVDTALRSITYANSSDNPPTSVTLRYTLNDGNGPNPTGVQGTGGPLSTTSDVTINITPVNDNPVAVNDANSITEGAVAAATGNVITTGPGADSDVDNLLTALQAQGVAVGTPAGPLSGNVGSPIAGSYGTLTLNADGSYSYVLDNANPTVNALSAGASINDVFTYTINDGAGGTATARLTITINGANDAPLGGDRNVTTPEDTPFVFVGSNFTLGDPDADATLSAVRIDSLPALGTLTLSGAPVTVGQVITAAQLSSLQYNPPLNQNGTAYTTFAFSVRDDQNAFSAAPSTMTINVTPVNDPPVAVADTNAIVQGAVNVGGNVISGPGTDTDVDNTTAQLSVAGVQAGSVAGPLLSGTGAPITGAYGSIRVNADGTYTYTLNNASPAVLALTPGQSLTDVYSYTVRDPAGGTSTTTVTITINGINNPPAGTDRTLSATEDTPLTIQPTDFGFTDVDTGDSLKDVRIDTLPTSGTLLLNGVAVTPGQIITAADLTAGRLTYLPAANVNRDSGTPPSFTFSVRDQGNLFDPAPNTITLDIAPVNDPPVATSRSPISATPGTGTPINPPAPTDLESPTSDLTVTITQLPTSGSGTIRLADGTPVTAGQTLTAAQFAGLVFVPNPNYTGPLLADGSFDAGRLTWFATDPGGLTSSTAGVDLRVAPLPIQPPLGGPPPPASQPPVLDFLNGNSGSTGAIAGGVVPLFSNSGTSLVSVTPLMGYLSGDPLYFEDPRVLPSDLRLPIPFSPVLFVIPQVRESQDAREFFDVVAGGARAAMLRPYFGGPGAGRGLGMTPGLFVTQAVAESRDYRELDELRADTIRDPLGLDGGGLVDYWPMGPEDTITEPAASEESADPSLKPQQYQGDENAEPATEEEWQSQWRPDPRLETSSEAVAVNASSVIAKRGAAKLSLRPDSSTPAFAKSFSEMLRAARLGSGETRTESTQSTLKHRDGNPHA